MEDNHQHDCLESLKANLRTDPKNGHDFILLIRAIISDWIGADLPYPIDALEPLIGIDSQSDHLFGGSIKPVFGKVRDYAPTKRDEWEAFDLYKYFLPTFIEARKNLLLELSRYSP